MPSRADTVMGNNVKPRTGYGESWVLFAFERLPSPQEHSAAAASWPRRGPLPSDGGVDAANAASPSLSLDRSCLLISKGGDEGNN